MKNIINIIGCCMSFLFIQACTDLKDMPQQTASEYKSFQISFSTEEETITSLGSDFDTKSVDVPVDEGTADSYKVSDFLLFQFDDKDEIKGAISYYSYTEGMAIPVIVPEDDNVTYTAVVIANVHSRDYINKFSSVTTLGQLKSMFYEIQSLEQTYGKDIFVSGSGYDLLMNGATTITSATNRLECTLYRNVAKLTLVLKNPENSGLTIESARVCNIPNTIDWVDHLVDPSAVYPSTGKAQFFDYEVDMTALTPGTGGVPNEKTLIYYLPRNMRGVSSSPNIYEKNLNAPSNATYVDIYATKSDGSSVRYQFYLGQNMTNDYNVLPNHNHILSVTFNNAGIPDIDSRVRVWPGVCTLEYSNCYLINPTPSGVQTLYKIPVQERVNMFWHNEGGTEAISHSISDSDTWKAEVIWQDVPQQIIEFCNADGSMTADGGTASPQYTGNATLNFRPKAGVEGNVVIGIKRTTGGVESDGYLWSWHLWITNYAPDAGTRLNWVDGKYSTNVPGGQLQHYKGTLWDAEDAQYHNHWIMDRNLGAMNANSGSYSYSTKGGFVQFGRKDYMASSTTYTIKGAKIANCTPGMALSSLCNLAYSVKRPNYCFQLNDASKTWMYDLAEKPGRYSKTNYYNPDSWYPTGKTGKSFFDPCPQGWRLPVNGVYNGLFKDFSHSGVSWHGGYDLYLNGESGETTWIPAGGYMPTNSNACTTVYGGTMGKIGTATFSGNYCYQLQVESGSAKMYAGGGMHFNGPSGGVNLRCIQDKAPKR